MEINFIFLPSYNSFLFIYFALNYNSSLPPCLEQNITLKLKLSSVIYDLSLLLVG